LAGSFTGSGEAVFFRRFIMNGNWSALKYLVCIFCRSGHLERSDTGSAILCRDCGAAYPVLNGVPCFVADELVNFSEVALPDRDSFIAMKTLAYAGGTFISRMYNHYHHYAARRRREHGRGGITADIGFGIGEHYPFVTDKEKAEASVIGVDLDRFKLEFFAAAHPELPVLQASALQLPFADEVVGTVQLLATLEHFTPAELSMVIAEAQRILQPGGILIACYPAEGGLLLQSARKVMHGYIRLRTGFDLDSETVHHHPATAVQIKEALAGRSDLKIIDSSYYPLGISSINGALFLNETYVRI
jgi:SAM-dependent methyltransferase